MSFERDVNNFPEDWRGIVKKWASLNIGYYDRHSDLPAWYVENSNSALFAAAAWAEGHYALCEVDVEKKYYTGRAGRPASYAGRMDIELTIGEEVYWIEAKRRAFSLGEESNYSFRHSFMNASVEEAYANARQCRPAARDMGAKVASLVFFSGHIEPDMAERGAGATPRLREQLIASEVAALRHKMRELSDKMNGRVFHAIFSQRDCRIYANWQGYYWPAAFGVAAVIDD
ncbi:hypothetical protein HOY34_15040 [Xinfangfangia sp. D13-10-4-6]|uniref:hypothetical protein n=1 Tax=Pseudogemmobacter hezensis TaxID=2737662 RepID=UPI00155405AB|nr:hypothetical protein [Pseudogemmobacter hezensis]NPD16507.1 hypothetical protein [Pseudogemmobacter hezensis]